LKGEIEKKNQFNKINKTIKRIRIKIEIKTKIIFLLKGEFKKKKDPKKKKTIK
jgi:hypothetical protein